jgi:hypothetical protein
MPRPRDWTTRATWLRVLDPTWRLFREKTRWDRIVRVIEGNP